MLSNRFNVLVLTAAACWLPYCADIADPLPPANSENTCSKLSRQFGVYISAIPWIGPGTTSPDAAGKPATDEEVNQFAPILSSELAVYPREALRRACVYRIFLCDGLRLNGNSVSSFASYEENALYVNVDDLGREAYVRESIDHELFHLIDYHDDGDLRDFQWPSLNDPPFAYPTTATAATDNSSIEIDLHLHGFLNTYSMTSVREDKAEIFAHMVVNGAHVDELATKDSVIRAKVGRIKQLVHNFCPEMNEEFWRAATRVNRPSEWPVTAAETQPTEVSIPSKRTAASVALRRVLGIASATAFLGLTWYGVLQWRHRFKTGQERMSG